VLPSHVGALECRAMCAQSHVTTHGAGREAMAAGATRDMRLMWYALDRESCARVHFGSVRSHASALRSIFSTGLERTDRDQMCILANFHPLSHISTPTTCNTIEH
jgi:hypothetical protein